MLITYGVLFVLVLEALKKIKKQPADIKPAGCFGKRLTYNLLNIKDKRHGHLYFSIHVAEIFQLFIPFKIGA